MGSRATAPPGLSSGLGDSPLLALFPKWLALFGSLDLFYEYTTVPDRCFTRKKKTEEGATITRGCGLRKNSAIRDFALRLAFWDWFKAFFFVVTLVNAVLICAHDPFLSSSSNSWRNALEKDSNIALFAVLFTIEMVVGMFAFGLYGSGSYFTSVWRCIDFLSVVLSWIALLPQASNYSAIRLVRLLRTLTLFPSTRIILDAVLAAAPGLLTVGLFMAVFVLVFALATMVLFSGALRGGCAYNDPGNPASLIFLDPFVSCSLPCDTDTLDGGLGPAICIRPGGSACPLSPVLYVDPVTSMANSTMVQTVCAASGTSSPLGQGYLNFDHFGYALLNSLWSYTTEGWSATFQRLWHSWGASYFVTFLFVVHVYVGAFVLVELALAAVFDSYQDAQAAALLRQRTAERTAKQLLGIPAYGGAAGGGGGSGTARRTKSRRNSAGSHSKRTASTKTDVSASTTAGDDDGDGASRSSSQRGGGNATEKDEDAGEGSRSDGSDDASESNSDYDEDEGEEDEGDLVDQAAAAAEAREKERKSARLNSSNNGGGAGRPRSSNPPSAAPVSFSQARPSSASAARPSSSSASVPPPTAAVAARRLQRASLSNTSSGGGASGIGFSKRLIFDAAVIATANAGATTVEQEGASSTAAKRPSSARLPRRATSNNDQAPTSSRAEGGASSRRPSSAAPRVSSSLVAPVRATAPSLPPLAAVAQGGGVSTPVLTGSLPTSASSSSKPAPSAASSSSSRCCTCKELLYRPRILPVRFWRWLKGLVTSAGRYFGLLPPLKKSSLRRQRSKEECQETARGSPAAGAAAGLASLLGGGTPSAGAASPVNRAPSCWQLCRARLSSCLPRFYAWSSVWFLFNVVYTRGFEILSLCFTVANGALLAVALGSGISSDARVNLHIALDVFAFVMIIEACLRLYAWGPKRYFGNSLERLDFLLMVAVLADAIVDIRQLQNGTIAASGEPRGFIMVRSFRTLRLMLVWEGGRRTLRDLRKALPATAAILTVFATFLLIAGVVGMQVFGQSYSVALAAGKIDQIPRPSFSNLWSSIIAAFIITDTENSNDLLYETMYIAGPWSALYFVVMFFLGSWLFLNILAAILISSFEHEDEKEDLEEEEEGGGLEAELASSTQRSVSGRGGSPLRSATTSANSTPRTPRDNQSAVRKKPKELKRKQPLPSTVGPWLPSLCRRLTSAIDGEYDPHHRDAVAATKSPAATPGQQQARSNVPSTGSTGSTAGRNSGSSSSRPVSLSQQGNNKGQLPPARTHVQSSSTSTGGASSSSSDRGLKVTAKPSLAGGNVDDDVGIYQSALSPTTPTPAMTAAAVVSTTPASAAAKASTATLAPIRSAALSLPLAATTTAQDNSLQAAVQRQLAVKARNARLNLVVKTSSLGTVRSISAMLPLPALKLKILPEASKKLVFRKFARHHHHHHHHHHHDSVNATSGAAASSSSRPISVSKLTHHPHPHPHPHHNRAASHFDLSTTSIDQAAISSSSVGDVASVAGPGSLMKQGPEQHKAAATSEYRGEEPGGVLLSPIHAPQQPPPSSTTLHPSSSIASAPSYKGKDPFLQLRLRVAAGGIISVSLVQTVPVPVTIIRPVLIPVPPAADEAHNDGSAPSPTAPPGPPRYTQGFAFSYDWDLHSSVVPIDASTNAEDLRVHSPEEALADLLADLEITQKKCKRNPVEVCCCCCCCCCGRSGSCPISAWSACATAVKNCFRCSCCCRSSSRAKILSSRAAVGSVRIGSFAPSTSSSSSGGIELQAPRAASFSKREGRASRSGSVLSAATGFPTDTEGGGLLSSSSERKFSVDSTSSEGPEKWLEEEEACCSPSSISWSWWFALRRKAASLVVKRYFMWFSLAVIVWSCINVGLEDSNYTISKRYANASDAAIAAWFLFELIAELLARGFIRSPQSYFRNPWRWLDAFVVVVSVADVIVASSSQLEIALSVRSLRLIRAARALRSLRLMSSFSSVRLVMASLVASIPGIINVTGILLFFLFVTAIIGMSLFSGAFSYCNDPSPAITTLAQCVGTFTLTGNQCELLPTDALTLACQLSPAGYSFPRIVLSYPELRLLWCCSAERLGTVRGRGLAYCDGLWS
jgi:Ion transport protein